MLTFSLVCVLVVGGCSTANKNAIAPSHAILPPEMAEWAINQQLYGEKDFESVDLFLNRVARENPSKNVIWWADYRRAQHWVKKDPNVACENFSHLAADPQFPIRRVAYLRAHEVCPATNQILSRLEPFDLKNFDNWLFSDALDVAIEKARRVNNYDDLISLHIKKSKLPLRKEEKIEHTKSALKYARKIQDTIENSGQIKELTERLYDLSPSLNPNPKRSELLSVAHDFRYRRQFETARKIYRQVEQDKKSTLNEKIQAMKGIRQSYKLEQDRENFLAASKNIARFTESQLKKSRQSKADLKLFSESQLAYVRALWTENKIKEAETELQKALKVLDGRHPLAEYYWVKARMLEEKTDHPGAIENLKKALSEKPEQKDFFIRLNWYLAWNERKNQNHAGANEIYNLLLKEIDNPFERNQVLFWQAKTLQKMDRDSDAKTNLKELIDEDPLSYYGLLAHRELDRELPLDMARGKETKKTKPLLTRFLNSRMDSIYADWLVAVREERIAQNYLDTIAKIVIKEAPAEVDHWKVLLTYYSASNNYLALFNQLGNLNAVTRKSIIEALPNLIFPKPYYETVASAASRFGISVEFIYSIMRQESSFNPHARSPMDAFGLMQLLPEVARRSASTSSIDFRETEDLYSPHVNIPIGSAHLRELWDKYNGDLIPAVASYNASEKAIFNWLKTRYQGDTLEFVEDIPYDETRSYVKLVLRNFITYQIIVSTSDKMHFPEWTLKISRIE